MKDERCLSKRTWVLIHLGSLGLFAVWASGGSWESHDRWELATITILNPWVWWAVGIGALAAGPTLLVLACTSGGRPATWCLGIALLMSITVFPMAGFISLWSYPWTVKDSLTDADGQTYVLCSSSGFADSSLAVTRLDRVGVLSRRYEVLAYGPTNSWTSPGILRRFLEDGGGGAGAGIHDRRHTDE